MSSTGKGSYSVRRPPWWLRRRPLIGLGCALLLAVGVPLGWLSYDRFRQSQTDRERICAPGVERRGDAKECVGVSDGGYAFWPNDARLQRVVDLIADENKAIDATAGRIHISVAYLISVPLGESGAANRGSLRHELEGAYLAQWHHNRDESGRIRDGIPLIRLLIANNGDRANQWEPVVAQLLSHVDGPDPLLAVIGLGSSLDTTRRAIARLSEHDIPMVGSVITADDITIDPTTKQRLRALVRVAPTNSDEAKAAASYSGGIFQKPLIVRDDNPEDLFTRTLADAFRAQFRASATGRASADIPVEKYNTKLPNTRGTFNLMMANICQYGPDIVYFAGRGAQLQEFVEALPGRPCKDHHINIVTGDSAANLANLLTGTTPNTELIAGLLANVTLRYTGLAHPGAWAVGGRAFTPAQLDPKKECEHCIARVFEDEPQDDGRAIMGFDSMLVALGAIDATHQGAAEQKDPATHRGEMIQNWDRFHDARAIPGAGGWISLKDGNPQAKAIPILELTDKGVRFDAVSSSSPDGRPFMPQ